MSTEDVRAHLGHAEVYRDHWVVWLIVKTGHMDLGGYDKHEGGYDAYVRSRNLGAVDSPLEAIKLVATEQLGRSLTVRIPIRLEDALPPLTRAGS